MTDEVFTEQIAELLAGVCPGAQLDDATVVLWRKTFRCLPNRVFKRGIQKLIMTRKYSNIPPIGEIVEACVGDHHWLIPAHRRAVGGDTSTEQIMAAYERRYEERKAQPLLATKAVPQLGGPSWLPSGANWLPSDYTEEIQRLKKENSELSEKCRSLQAQLDKAGSAEYADQMAQRREALKAQPKGET